MNGDRIPIKRVGNLKLFDKKSRASYMLDLRSNILSVKRNSTDLNYNVIFSPNGVKFQDIENNKLITKGVAKEDLYLLEDTKSLFELTCIVNFASVLNRNFVTCSNWSSSC